MAVDGSEMVREVDVDAGDNHSDEGKE
jgi:hypothetical protein